MSSAVNESDERLFRCAEPNVPQAPEPNSASNEIAASPNVNGSRAPSPPESVAGIRLVLIEPRASAFWPPLITVAGPHSDPSHVRIEIVGTVPPFDRS